MASSLKSTLDPALHTAAARISSTNPTTAPSIATPPSAVAAHQLFQSTATAAATTSTPSDSDKKLAHENSWRKLPSDGVARAADSAVGGESYLFPQNIQMETRTPFITEIWRIVIGYACPHTLSIMKEIGWNTKALLFKIELEQRCAVFEGHVPFVKHMMTSLRSFDSSDKPDEPINDLDDLITNPGTEELRSLKERLKSPISPTESSWNLERTFKVKSRIYQNILKLDDASRKMLDTVVSQYFESTTAATPNSKPIFLRNVVRIANIRHSQFDEKVRASQQSAGIVEFAVLKPAFEALLALGEIETAEEWARENCCPLVQSHEFLIDYFLNKAKPPLPERAFALIDQKGYRAIHGPETGLPKIHPDFDILSEQIIDWHIAQGNTYAWDMIRIPRGVRKPPHEDILGVSQALTEARKLPAKGDFSGALVTAFSCLMKHSFSEPYGQHGMYHNAVPFLEFADDFLFHIDKMVKAKTTKVVDQSAARTKQDRVDIYTRQIGQILFHIPDDHELKIYVLNRWKEYLAIHEPRPPMKQRAMRLFQVAKIFIKENDLTRAFKVAENFSRPITLAAFLHAILEKEVKLSDEEVGKMIALYQKLPSELKCVLLLEADWRKQTQILEAMRKQFDLAQFEKEADAKVSIVFAPKGQEEHRQLILVPDNDPRLTPKNRIEWKREYLLGHLLRKYYDNKEPRIDFHNTIRLYLYNPFSEDPFEAVLNDTK